MPLFNHISGNKKHDFRHVRLTILCNFTFCNYMFDAFIGEKQVFVIHTAFVNPFDSVYHMVLIAIFKTSDFGYPLLSWFN